MRLDAYLAENDLSVDKFADMIGVNRTTVYRFLDGTSFPNAQNRQSIKEVTGGKVTADDLFEGWEAANKQRKL